MSASGHGVIVEFLEPKDVAILDKVLTQHGIEYINAFARFWENDRLQIDGDVSLKEMQALTEAMQLMAGGGSGEIEEAGR